MAEEIRIFKSLIQHSGTPQDVIALGPKGRDGSVFLLDRNRRRKRKPDWLQNSVDPQRVAVPCAGSLSESQPLPLHNPC